MSSHPPHSEVILDSIADGVFTVDREFRITSFNRAAERITGVARGQAIGQNCFEVFRADICQGECALRRTIEDGQEVIDQPANILTSDGRLLSISISTAVLRGEGQEVVGGAETFRDLSTLELLREELRGRHRIGNIVSKNREVRRLLHILPDIAASESTVLVEGPSGSGKELFARAIHDQSRRSSGPFVAVNCGALPDTLLESELFGYRPGAFTGATKEKPGRFELARGGTLFLDEIGDISPAVQVRLLRVLQEKEYEPLGSTGPVEADVRVVAATHKPLAGLVAQGSFRDDLYYRLNVVRLELPSLAERRDDIPLLLETFIERFNAMTGKRVRRVSPAALAELLAHDYPGNVRELENAVEHAFVLVRRAEIGLEHLPIHLRGGVGRSPADQPPSSPADPFARAEAAAILEALRLHDGHRGRTAEQLGVNKSTLWRKMKRLGLVWPPTD